MNNFKYLPFLALSLAHFACSFIQKTECLDMPADNKSTSSINVLNFPEKGQDTLKTSYFADTIFYIPLETTNKNFIQSIRKQIWMNDSIFLINNRFNLLMYSKNGKFIRQIGNRGKGPGENQSIYCFDVIGDTIYLSSSGKRSIIKHTLSGVFCEEVDLKDELIFFTSSYGNKLTAYDREKGVIIVYNDNLNMADTIKVEYGLTVGRYKYMYGNSFMTYFQQSTTGLLFNNYMNDTIWNITKNGKEPAFILNMKERLLPRDKQIDFCEGDYDRWMQKAKTYKMVHLLPFQSQMLIFEMHWCEKNYSAIYLQDRKAGELRKFNTYFIYDDIIGMQKLSNFVFAQSKDYLVSVVYPHELQEYLTSNLRNVVSKASPAWLNQMKSVDKNDNPILVLIKVKNHLLNSK